VCSIAKVILIPEASLQIGRTFLMQNLVVLSLGVVQFITLNKAALWLTWAVKVGSEFSVIIRIINSGPVKYTIR